MEIFFQRKLLSKSDSGRSKIEAPSNIISPKLLPPDNILINDNPKVLFPQALSPAIPIDSPKSKSKSTSSTA